MREVSCHIPTTWTYTGNNRNSMDRIPGDVAGLDGPILTDIL